jgi:hypothetical protein
MLKRLDQDRSPLHIPISIANYQIKPVNLALAFARRGIRTGILDTDIFGPSIPTLLNLSGEPRLDDSEQNLRSSLIMELISAKYTTLTNSISYRKLPHPPHKLRP